MRNKWVYPAFIFVFTLVSAEVLLRIAKKDVTWSEMVGSGYRSGYNQTEPTWFRAWPNRQTVIDQKEFKFLYNTNALGIRERDTFYTDSTAVRILCLGDSYTEGFGAPYDSSYPRVMERSLNARGFHSQVYNAGIAGSDPFYAYMLLKEKLLLAHPKYVLITFNGSDLTDFIYRGGMERFKPDGTVEGRKGPWYEPVYQHSYFFRFLLRKMFRKIRQNLFLTRHEYEDIYCPRAVRETVAVFRAIHELGKKEGFEVLVIIQPIANDIAETNWENDVIKAMFWDMEKLLTASDIKLINMWRVLDGKITLANKNELAYPNDSHFKPSGYLLFAENLLVAIDKKYPGYWK